MSLGLVSPLLNRGVRSRWLASLPGAGSKMLTIDSNGDTSFQDIPVAAWGSITGTLSAQTDLQSALNGKLSLTGGTLTGGLYFSGAAGARLEMSSQQYTPSNVAINMPWGSGTVQGIYGSNGLVGFASAGFSYFEVNTSGLRLASTRSIAMGGTIASPEVFAFSGGSNVWEQRNSTNAQRFNLYGTYTDASNYRRLYLSSTTAGAFTLGVEGAGTGASGNTLTIGNNLTVNGELLPQSLYVNSSNWFGVANRAIFSSPSDGVMKLTNWADNNFFRLQLGGTNSSFPAIKRNGTAINFRLADDSADAPITAAAGTFSGNVTASSFISSSLTMTGGSPSSVSSGNRLTFGTSAAYIFYKGGNSFTLDPSGGNAATFGGAVLATRLELVNSTTSTRADVYNTYTDASNYIRQSLSFTTYSSTVHAQLAAEGAGTGAVNVPFVITPRGTGAFILGPMPDGTATGGNARGANAVDLQTTRSAATQVASGQSSFTAGSRNSATGIYSVAVGWNTVASAEGAFAAGVSCGANSNATFAIGQGAVASGYGSAAIGYDCVASGGAAFATGRASSAHSSATQAHSSGVLTNRGTGLIGGGSQHILWTLAASTVPNVATEPFTAAAGGTALNVRVVVPNNTLQSGIITINGIRSDGGQCCHFVRRYACKNIANTVSQLAAAEAIGTDIANGCSIAISANNTTKHIEVLLTAPAARFSGITGSEATDVITLNAHGFVNGEEIAFSGLVGGTGLSNDVLYFVRDVTTNTFKVTTGYPSNTATNFTTDITNGSVDYCWNWTVKCNMEETKRGI